ncbi:MAG: GntR family transcriptional regulator, partial [Promicromonosporaceae bacterium]|nr:GntR family transcriptional regulator [Promicromonosporaceae bacterium]
MPIPKMPVDLQSGGVRRTAYDLLLDAIVRGDLAPGERLYDEDLEARFGTTRSAVRAALAELESEWLVRIVPRKGTFVADLDTSRGGQAVEGGGGLARSALRDAGGRLT